MQAYVGNCSLPRFNAQEGDATIWEAIKEWVTDPDRLAQALQGCKAEQVSLSAPLRERLAVADQLLADNRAQLGRLLDLHLSGEMYREMLVDRLKRYEEIIQALEAEKTTLVSTLETRELSQEQIRTIEDFAAEIRDGLGVAEADFASRRRIVEALDVQAVLELKPSADGSQQKNVRASCLLGKRDLALGPLKHLLT